MYAEWLIEGKKESWITKYWWLIFIWIMYGFTFWFTFSLGPEVAYHFQEEVTDELFTVQHIVLIIGQVLGWMTILVITRFRFSYLKALVFSEWIWFFVGFGIYAAAFPADLGWHWLFGIEKDLDAIMSPTHLLTGVGLTIMFSSVALSQVGKRAVLFWHQLPIALSLSTALAFAGLMTNWVHPIFQKGPVLKPFTGTYYDWAAPASSIAGSVIQTALLMMGLHVFTSWKPTKTIWMIFFLVLGILTAFPKNAWEAVLIYGLVGLVTLPIRKNMLLITIVVPVTMWAGSLVTSGAISSDVWTAHAKTGYIAYALAAGIVVYAFLAIMKKIQRSNDIDQAEETAETA